mmetsp:Transcript_2818/g.8531  ORF Transcript_2818/g.8531 Transcript_2818/m.8531 type:complete len:220 (+) Transcript_2818:110-769(+)
MGSAASIAETGKIEEMDMGAFKSSLEQAWAVDGGAQQEQIKDMLATAKRFVERKQREQSVGLIPFPPEKARLDELWKVVDVNDNNMTTLAELDKMIVENYPGFNNKPAIMRAYHACDRNGNGFISHKEFTNFMGYLDYFTKLWEKFEDIDENQDRRIDFNEMCNHSREIFGRELSEDAAIVLFNTIDRNHGGKILFYEFCAHMAVLDRKDFAVDKLPFE